MERKERIGFGKILVTTIAVVAGACAVIWFAMKLYRKYCLLECCDYDEELDEIYNDGLYNEENGCEVVLDNETEEVAIDTEA